MLIGGSVGSVVGDLARVADEHMRTLVAAGAAGAIGASFNAPIGGMLFAIELIVGRFQVRSMQVIVITSVVASVTARQLVGPGIVFKPRETYGLGDPRELLLYGVLGLIAAVAGVAFLFGPSLVRQFFRRSHIWRPLQVAAGGLGVGLIALFIPEVLGTGADLPPIEGVRDPIQQMLDGTLGDAGMAAAALLGVLAVAKLGAASLSVGSGNAVGTFAPTLFVGAAIGGAMGHIADVVLPGQGLRPGAFALVGMAAVFSASAQAPLTAIVIAFELTGDYELVLPLMLAAGLAVYVANRLEPESIYTYPLRKEGIVYAEPTDIDIMQSVTVGEVMTRDPDVVPPWFSLPQLREEFNRTRHHGFPVVDDEDEDLVGVVTLTDLNRAEDRIA
ncbi:MAG: chloride channel protein, partial [Nitriliruptorales bacterium]|nr:chloride channel protein [Nitriliruptorales bacterium]